MTDSLCGIISNKSRTLPFENRKNILSIALSPDGKVLLSIDEGESGWLLYRQIMLNLYFCP